MGTKFIVELGDGADVVMTLPAGGVLKSVSVAKLDDGPGRIVLHPDLAPDPVRVPENYGEYLSLKAKAAWLETLYLAAREVTLNVNRIEGALIGSARYEFDSVMRHVEKVLGRGPKNG